MRREELRSSPSDTAGHGIMDTFLELVLQGVDPQHRKAFVETLSREALLKQYEQGKSGVRHCFRFADGENFRWIETSVIFYTNDSGDVCDFTLVRWAPELGQG